jgi:hypothetical protein
VFFEWSTSLIASDSFEDMEHLIWCGRISKFHLAGSLPCPRRRLLVAALLALLLLVGRVGLLPLHGDDCPLNAERAPVLSDDPLPPLPELGLGCALDVLGTLRIVGAQWLRAVVGQEGVPPQVAHAQPGQG